MFGEEDELQPSGKVFKKLLLGPYQWTSYDQADQVVTYTVLYCTVLYCTVLGRHRLRGRGQEPRPPAQATSLHLRRDQTGRYVDSGYSAEITMHES